MVVLSLGKADAVVGNFPWGVLLAMLGVAVPLIAFLYEFIFVRRKRLGYRVQMDTIAADETHSEYAGVLQQLQKNGTRLVDPSFVLLRIENNGITHIDTHDYAVLDNDKVGIQASFPGRLVTGMVVTELSDEFLRRSFSKDSGLNMRDGVIELPKVPLNRAAHYKVLAVLERAPDNNRSDPRKFDAPQVVGGIKGGVGTGGIRETQSRTGMPPATIALICFLVLISLAQLTGSIFFTTKATPLDCATGNLTLTGSTAFAPALRDAADKYQKTCPGATFDLQPIGSAQGIRRLDDVGREQGPGSPDMLAFSDGKKEDGHPQLLPRTISFIIFTLVINEKAGVRDLTLEQIKRLYAGTIRNWKDVGGNDQPVRLVGRYEGSGSRNTFQKKVLGEWEPGVTSEDCKTKSSSASGNVIRCERASTEELLKTVAGTDGAIGYSEVGDASRHKDLRLVLIDSHPATLDAAEQGAYFFWETEYAYTYAEPLADSLAASFLRYLTNEVGKDIVRSYGYRPCTELRNPVLCQPR